MTEARWLVCKDPQEMLDVLRAKLTRTASGRRKLRLLACASVRRFWDVMLDRWDRNAVLVAERYADGQASKAELLAAREAARDYITRRRGGGGPSITWPAQLVAVEGAWEAATWALRDCADTAWLLARDSLSWAKDMAKSASVTGEKRWHCLAVRDIFHSPFHAVPRAAASWLRWNDGTVPKIAQGIYEERAFDRLPILADALMDAGCDDEAILSHCRGEGPHVRGCWVIDLILGKS
jgi:hypothetical protein